MKPFLFKESLYEVAATIVYKWRTSFGSNRWPQVMTIKETVDHLLNTQCSLVRFGDGELAIINGSSIGFQCFSPTLSQALVDTITTDRRDVLVCVPGVFNGMKHVERATRRWWIKHLLRGDSVWKSLTSPGRLYGNAFVSRPYMMHHHFEAAEIASLFRSIRQLWDGRNLTIVEGANTRFGIGNDLLEGALSVTRILCPNKNAYEELEQIKERCSGADPGNLFLVALGPAAKPLVMHLQESGLRALDVGHLDIEYEWYRRSAKTPSPVPGKAVNEAGTRGYEADEAEQTDFANYLRP